MKLKKILTGSALSLALLVSAAPAFASSPGNTNSDSTQTKISTQATKDSFTMDYLHRWDIPNTTVKNGVTYYLKKVEIIEGFYRATFEGWIN
ncbi:MULTISPECIES: hypothetical protein [Bacillus]|uniref:hypothetical protein n=1 Tax=Bacillus TaxID=1386 RepID=UPI000BA6FDA6|nr:MULTISPECIES: hypothetical protein [Bacillus]MDH3081444.1 hypothetical protein [Bacillus amyloliquefaciens]MDU0074828.1 hypothetical protein [Bacillus sp. IG2]MDU0100538.1 hypothetical protein [Bacillus sp. IS1]MEC2272799.1 hypothetical protein [Bacillus velezensis]MED3680975.1 hypothetical protein [Bacillus velezensis]